MIAVDTNVVVRYLMADDPTQSQRARTLIETEAIFFSATVLLETAWVLGSVFGRQIPEIVAALRSFAALPRVTLEDRRATLKALDWADAGLDIADALHLARTRHCDAFATFDRTFVKAATRSGIGETRLL